MDEEEEELIIINNEMFHNAWVAQFKDSPKGCCSIAVQIDFVRATSSCHSPPAREEKKINIPTSLFAEPELTMMIAVLACHPPSVPTLIMKPLHVTPLLNI
ncbi:hypothetical protein OUZ56_030525 [Daphnia magna]|uniref:Uncharacterized protein n=1 Tax=Daphnia magna TaxID=35525 RepID=A0ABQ9ZS46_9CRUS|nr:hypothetical protein OUZ56_030525 [Daphnia magna]